MFCCTVQYLGGLYERVDWILKSVGETIDIGDKRIKYYTVISATTHPTGRQYATVAKDHSELGSVRAKVEVLMVDGELSTISVIMFKNSIKISGKVPLIELDDYDAFIKHYCRIVMIAMGAKERTEPKCCLINATQRLNPHGIANYFTFCKSEEFKVMGQVTYPFFYERGDISAMTVKTGHGTFKISSKGNIQFLGYKSVCEIKGDSEKILQLVRPYYLLPTDKVPEKPTLEVGMREALKSINPRVGHSAVSSK